ncbi:MAG: hypothetical protein RL015_2717 [Verrucomicrobiota bacterium]
MMSVKTQKVPVSVAIPAYESSGTLRQTLQKICACDPLPDEILIHCDGSWIMPDEVIQGLALPVRVLRSSDNLGPGGGRHLLFQEARCELIASFDDDSWPLDREYFAQVCAVMDAFPLVAVMSPAVYLHEKPILAPFLEAHSARSFEGSASVHRKSVYLTLPGYVSVPAAYGVEEADLSLQIHAAGYEILSCPWLRAWHDRPYADHLHTVLPWIRNEVLLAYLRFPYVAQPWGWLRALRHILRHRKQIPLRQLLREFAHSLPHAVSFQRLVKRYSLSDVWHHHRRPQKCYALEVTDKLKSLSVSLVDNAKRVLYIQYTNPGGYPPLEHSARMLARHGWLVEFCGLSSSQVVSLEFAQHPRMMVRRMTYMAPGLLQKMHYLKFVIWCLWRVIRWRPDWIYASDALSTPITQLLLSLSRCRILYHEHDSPSLSTMKKSWFLRFVSWCRLRVGRKSDIVILPNKKRLEAFTKATKTEGAAFCVWNCPELDEIPQAVPCRDLEGPLKVLYHGSIVPDRFGASVLEALAECNRDVQVRLIGYLPQGYLTYAAELQEKARQLGVTERFEYLGAIPHRVELMRIGAECHVGLCLLRIHDQDINMQYMAGASNKPFDYLSQGISLIVPPDPEWEQLFVQNGCAKTCPINDSKSLAELFCWMADHRAEVAEMGRAGHKLIQEQWNYEKLFAPVLREMQNSLTPKS